MKAEEARNMNPIKFNKKTNRSLVHIPSKNHKVIKQYPKVIKDSYKLKRDLSRRKSLYLQDSLNDSSHPSFIYFHLIHHLFIVKCIKNSWITPSHKDHFFSAEPTKFTSPPESSRDSEVFNSNKISSVRAESQIAPPHPENL